MPAMYTIASKPDSPTSASFGNGNDGSKSSTQTPILDSAKVLHAATFPDRYVVTHEKTTDWADPKNVYNPFNWPRAKKWRVTILASFMTFVIQVNGTMMTSAAEQINQSFHISDEHFPHSYWPVLSWNLGGAAAPLFGLPLMETLGVRRSYLVSYWGAANHVGDLTDHCVGHLCRSHHLRCSSSGGV
jgi:hypothetical protein